MGIKNLNKFLRDQCPGVFTKTHLSQFGFKKIAIDISLYLHKFKAIAGERWLAAFLNLVSCLRRNNIHCVFVFDGKAPVEKNHEREKRRMEREKLEKSIFELQEAVDVYEKTGVVSEILVKLWKRRRSPKRLLGSQDPVDMEWVIEKVKQKSNQLISIFPQDYETAKELFSILEIPCITAPGEAEKMCSKLCIDGKVDAVLSEDTDVIAYGTPIFLTKIDTSADTVVVLANSEIREALDFSYEQLLDLCIMCGTDYNTNIFRVGAHKSYKKLQTHGNIEGIEAHDTVDTSILKYKNVRKLFTEFNDCCDIAIPYCGTPNHKKLLHFINYHKIWYDNRRSNEENKISIEKRLESLTGDFTTNILVFEE
tara:strand:+ start:3521 stop:4621 length:1101 start_codon:yes stop_codon:yes gene_type:complete